jgi:hypothetical protein
MLGTGHFRHAPGEGDNAERRCDIGRIAGFDGIGHEGSDFLVIDQCGGGVVGGERFGHPGTLFFGESLGGGGVAGW